MYFGNLALDPIWIMDGDGELRLTIMVTLAQEESRKISERVRAGQAVSRENGVLYGNGNIIGYDRVNGTYVINPEQAQTIRTVFELYAQGLGQKEIVNELTLRGRKDGEGKVKWSCVKISRILRNATYMGYVCYNKSKTNNFLEKKRIKNLDDDSITLMRCKICRSLHIKKAHCLTVRLTCLGNQTEVKRLPVNVYALGFLIAACTALNP